MKEPGSYAEAVAVKQDGWAAEDSDEEGTHVNVLVFHVIFLILYPSTGSVLFKYFIKELSHH